jgi:hypothetical protein
MINLDDTSMELVREAARIESEARPGDRMTPSIWVRSVSVRRAQEVVGQAGERDRKKATR